MANLRVDPVKDDKKDKKSMDPKIICYECKKTGHIKYECLVLIKKMRKYKK